MIEITISKGTDFDDPIERWELVLGGDRLSLLSPTKLTPEEAHYEFLRAFTVMGSQTANPLPTPVLAWSDNTWGVS